jgi:hypothetical protein
MIRQFNENLALYMNESSFTFRCLKEESEKNQKECDKFYEQSGKYKGMDILELSREDKIKQNIPTQFHEMAIVRSLLPVSGHPRHDQICGFVDVCFHILENKVLSLVFAKQDDKLKIMHCIIGQFVSRLTKLEFDFAGMKQQNVNKAHMLYDNQFVEITEELASAHNDLQQLLIDLAKRHDNLVIRHDQLLIHHQEYVRITNQTIKNMSSKINHFTFLFLIVVFGLPLFYALAVWQMQSLI